MAQLTLIRAALAALSLLTLSAAAVPRMAAAEPQPSPDQIAVQALREDVAIATILGRLQASPVPEVTIVRNVRVVDPVEGTVTANRSVVISDGKVVGQTLVGQEPNVPNARIVDGDDHFLSPGLTDMHVHSNWASAWLLDLANGVTTVREMDGFPWMLDVRAHVESGRMLAPTLYVAGTIINGFDMGGYAVVPRDPLDAQRIVRQQAACGYNFIKVHNVVPQPIFDAVAAEAARQGLDLVGHVPHDIAVRYAVDHGMRTLEHLKGFLNDATQQAGDTDYAAVAAPNVWVTPTLYAGRAFTTPDVQRAMLAEPASRYVPERRRASWIADSNHPDDAFRLAMHGEDLRRQITRTLAATPGVQFLAGTDSAFYDYGVMGFALVEELQLLQANGLSPRQATRAGTSEPAAAMRVPDSFGRIRRGMRADLVLLASNPLENVSAYKANLGVMVRGRWLERTALEAALAQLAELYARPMLVTRLDRADARALVARASALVASGYVFSAPILLHAADALRHVGYADDADALVALADAPSTGPCAAPLPQ